MGTRGLIGFYREAGERDGGTKATYNHFDSYPSGVGKDILKELKETYIKKGIVHLHKVYENIKLIYENSPKPTKKQIEECKEFINNMNNENPITWYFLLREAQGTLKPYLDLKLKYMKDNQEFIKDSLFCEWAYIINLTTKELEVYKGFVKNENKNQNRYVEDYTVCELIKTYPFDKLPSEKDFVKELEEEDEE